MHKHKKLTSLVLSLVIVALTAAYSFAASAQQSPSATITLTPETYVVGAAPSILKISGGKPPYKVQQTGGNVGVNIQQTDAASFNLIAQTVGSATFTVFDQFNNNLGSKTLTIKLPNVTLALTPETIEPGAGPATLMITGAAGPISLRQTGGTEVIFQKTDAASFKLIATKVGSATFSVFDQFGNNLGSKTLTIKLPNVTLALTPETIEPEARLATLMITGAAGPISLRQTGGKPPYKVQQTGGNVGVNIQQTDAASFNLIATKVGSATVTVFDHFNNNLGSKTLTIKLPNVTLALTPETIELGAGPATLKITGAVGPILRQTGGNVGVNIQKTGAASFNLIATKVGSATFSVFDQFGNNLGSKTLTITKQERSGSGRSGPGN